VALYRNDLKALHWMQCSAFGLVENFVEGVARGQSRWLFSQGKQGVWELLKEFVKQ
jgi:hypothetical protein